MIRTTPTQPLVHATAPAQRRAVVAVLTGSTSRDVTVARLAAQHASTTAAQLVLAVPSPARPFGPTAADLTGRRMAPQAVVIAARVLPRLEHPTPSTAVITVPFVDRGAADRSGRVAAALVELSRRLAARELVVAGAALGGLGAVRLPDHLAAAIDQGRLPLTRLTVVPHTETRTRPHRADGPAPDEPTAPEQSVPTARRPADQTVQVGGDENTGPVAAPDAQAGASTLRIDTCGIPASR